MINSRRNETLALVCLLALGSLGSPVHGILVRPVKESCPVCREDIYLTKLVSRGSYIFEWPSKYDLIYAPETRKLFIVTCTHCGYTQTLKDFLSISKDHVQRLRAADFIREWGPTSEEVPFATRLERAILTNEVIERDDEFWVWFNRILIYHFRELDPERARHFAAREIALLESNKVSPVKRNLYLLGEYNRLVGNADTAKRYLEEARRTSINRELILGLVVLGGVCVAFGVLVCYLSRKRRLVIVSVVVVVVAALVWCCWSYTESKQPNDYFDRIIDDRLELLTSAQSDQTRETRKGIGDTILFSP